MDSAIQKALLKMRGQDPGLVSAGSQSAPIMNDPGLSQAYGTSNPAVQSQSSPFQFNQGLENQAQAQGGNIPMHPLIKQIMQHLGMLNMIRNQSNQSVVNPASI